MRESFESLNLVLTALTVLIPLNFEAPSLLKTTDHQNGSNVLFLKHVDENVRPTQFSNRKMNSAKRKYTNCVRKALAVVFALRKYRE